MKSINFLRWIALVALLAVFNGSLSGCLIIRPTLYSKNDPQSSVENIPFSGELVKIIYLDGNEEDAEEIGVFQDTLNEDIAVLQIWDRGIEELSSQKIEIAVNDILEVESVSLKKKQKIWGAGCLAGFVIFGFLAYKFLEETSIEPFGDN